jgi:hypothetical protein
MVPLFGQDPSVAASIFALLSFISTSFCAAFSWTLCSLQQDSPVAPCHNVQTVAVEVGPQLHINSRCFPAFTNKPVLHSDCASYSLLDLKLTRLLCTTYTAHNMQFRWQPLLQLISSIYSLSQHPHFTDFFGGCTEHSNRLMDYHRHCYLYLQRYYRVLQPSHLWIC